MLLHTRSRSVRLLQWYSAWRWVFRLYARQVRGRLMARSLTHQARWLRCKVEIHQLVSGLTGRPRPTVRQFQFLDVPFNPYL